ncbi:UvrABC system protein A [Acinetobacter baumannii]|nr:UvrABC system protein A [Acinetobacter baumannii]
MSQSHIRIRGARTHNLKNVSLDIPRDKFVVITGLSGSGKSSLAFDTLYAEGQRRYVESLSAYARQFLSQMENLKLTRLKVYHQPLRLSKSLLAITHVQRLVRLPKFMTICVCFMHVSVRLIALNTTYLWLRKLFLKWSMR